MCALWLLPGIAGCESDEEKCRKARAAATAEWTAYVAALDGARAQAVETQRQAHATLSHEIEQRLSPEAQRIADGRYARSDGAWVRAHTIAMNEACQRDAQCSDLKRRNAEATASIADLDERLPLARAALEAARGPAEAAKRAAEAAIIHPEYPQLKRAQQLTAAAAELCGDRPPAPEPPR